MIIRPKYLGDYKGELCVIDEDSLSDEPKMLVLYWPTGIRTADFLASYGSDMIGRQVRSGRFAGSYIIDGTRLQINLTEGGQTRPIHNKIIPIPAPKVRKGIEVRYYNGRWQKYLKTKGWVTIPQGSNNMMREDKARCRP